MIDIGGQFFSFKLSELGGFERIETLAWRESVIPEGFDPLHFTRTQDENLVRLRRSLDAPPEERALLKREHQLHMRKLQASAKDAAQQITGLSSVIATEFELRQGHVSLSHVSERLSGLLDAVNVYFSATCRVQGNFYYPKCGFRTWHTNFMDSPGWRMYLVCAEEGEKSFFRLKVPASGDIHTQWDEKFTVNFFLINPNRLMWHCIASDTNRWSKGFLIPDDWQQKLQTQ